MMCPFSVTVQYVPDRELGPLLTQLSQAGFDSPIITSLGANGGSESVGAVARRQTSDLPDDWRLVRERDGEAYRWPNGRDRYSPYRVFISTTRTEGAVQITLGETIRENKWGRDRKYVVAFLTGGSPQQPLVEFVAADDLSEPVSSSRSSAAATAAGACTAPATPSPRSTHTAFEPRPTTSGSTIRRLEQGRRRRPRGRQPDDPQPRTNPKPTTTTDLMVERASARSLQLAVPSAINGSLTYLELLFMLR
jgi:hypothetical protein